MCNAYVLPSLLTCKHINSLAPSEPTYHQRHWAAYWLTLLLLELSIFPLVTLSLSTTPNVKSLLFKCCICSWLYLPRFLGATVLADRVYSPLMLKHEKTLDELAEKVRGVFFRGVVKTLLIATTSGVGGLIEQLGLGLGGIKGRMKKSPSSSLRDSGRGFDVVLCEGLYVFLKIKEKFEMVILGGGGNGGRGGRGGRGVCFKKLDGDTVLEIDRILGVEEQGDVGLVIRYEGLGGGRGGRGKESCEVKLCETEDRDVLREGLESYVVVVVGDGSGEW
ncbi:hypothetical protein TL16_g12596 [Triparma laevis f. inornata]|uniref:HVA22-like protein n=1 Tax=Triparma laevis f. inornata TaxID=1714386 RepID=A0A9W7BTN4_9STRA|nr:hypothetical protein TL16_g12596 [Triparma laevis f. inornata]